MGQDRYVSIWYGGDQHGRVEVAGAHLEDHYGLAEHGPTEPKDTNGWAMRELRGVLDDIQAVKRAQPTSSQD
jgi:hypothetical protein